MLGLLGEGLTQRKIAFLCLTGASKDRGELVDQFESGKADVFLISLKAGGTGLNLVSADTVIHYDPWWNAAAQMQATDRAYRIGQKKPVFVYNLIASSSVEERMMTLQARKRHLADTILGKAGSISALSAADVEDLFAPLDPKVQEEREGSEAPPPGPRSVWGGVTTDDDDDDNALAPK
jgi:SNF2 family DNA or RNA helicase